ncbi:hypothetical protein [Myxococcus phage Mx4 ts27htf-1hrm-1]|nr:hypothetical protein [Myxococcus phage Mx4 ts27htf-1hrm-1]
MSHEATAPLAKDATPQRRRRQAPVAGQVWLAEIEQRH